MDVALRGNGNGDKGLAAEFPDLVDGGQKEDALCDEASLILEASIVRRASSKRPDGSYPPDAPKVLSMREAMGKAARILAHDGVAERERQKLQQDAGRSAGAELPSPAGIVAAGERSWEEEAGAKIDQALKQ